MSDLRYVSGTGGVVLELDGPSAFAGAAEGIRGREWSYELGVHKIGSVRRQAREVQADVLVVGYACADEMRRVLDRDVAMETPGRLELRGWSQRAYAVAMTPSEIVAGHVKQTLTLVLLDGCWTRLVTREYRPRTAAGGYGWLDLPTDFPADLGPSLPTSDVTVDCPVRPNVRLVIYGPCVNPYVIVGSNRYAVNRTIADGERIEIDGRDKTIVQVMADGTRVSRFSDGVRTGGEGGGSYIFERLPVSQYQISVSWDNSFGFDLCWYEEEGEPPWSLY